MVLRALAWWIAIVYGTLPSYWLVVHGRAGRWAAHGGRRLLRVGPLWLLMWVAAALITAPFRTLALYHALWAWIPGALLIACGVPLYVTGQPGFSTAQVLGRSELEPHKHEQRLVTTGIRTRIRHPYYLAHLCELAGWTIGSGLLVCYALLAFALITGYLMIRAEERELEQRFGDTYRTYRLRSAAMFPGFW